MSESQLEPISEPISSYTGNHLLATPTSFIPAGGDTLHRPKDDMDQLIKNELYPVFFVKRTNNKRTPMGGERVLWEEKIQARTTILDDLIPRSDLTVNDICRMKYVKKQGEHLIYGVALLQPLRKGHQWSLNGAPFPRSSKKSKPQDDETDTNLEERDEDEMIETDGSGSQGLFNPDPNMSSAVAKTSEEKKWERLLRSIQYHMRKIIRRPKKSDTPSPLHFDKVPALPQRYWSSEFSNKPIQDPNDTRKPDLVLMDYRLKTVASANKTWVHILTNIEITKSDMAPDKPIFLGITTKAYLIMREQPWRRFVIVFSIANFKLRAHYLDRSGIIISTPIEISRDAVRFVDVLNAMTLSDLPSLGFDPTIHVCIDICSNPHDDLPEGIDAMPEGAKGWVTDDEKQVYWIMEVLWKSHGLFSRGTVCYRVQDKHGAEFALKDCWVDEGTLENEVRFLKAVAGISNVVSLTKYWDVQYKGERDSTSRIRKYVKDYLPESPIYSNKVHRRMLLTPCGLPLKSFKSSTELIKIFQDIVVAHETIVTQRKVLHSDLSPNNLVIHDGKGYLIDFDHAKFLKDDIAVDSRGTGTVPYISYRLLDLMANPHPPSTINHKPCDDLESLFYILIEFVAMHEGPSDTRVEEGAEPDELDEPAEWRGAHMKMNLGPVGNLKFAFLTKKSPRYKISPNFQAYIPMLEAWRRAIGKAILDERDLSYKEVREIIQQGLEECSKSLPGTLTLPSVASSSGSSITVPLPTSPLLPTSETTTPHRTKRTLASGSMGPPPPETLSERRLSKRRKQT